MSAALTRETLAAIGAEEPRWLTDLRARALSLFETLPLPDRALHRWRYVDPAKLQPGDRPLRRETGTVRLASLAADADSSVVVRRRSGETVVALSDDARAAGVEVLDLAVAARDRGDLVRPFLAKLVPPAESPFAALNAAFWSGGLFLAIPRAVRLDKPVHVVTEIAGEGLVLPRSLVLVGEGAEVTLLEELTGELSGDLTGEVSGAAHGTAAAPGLLVHRTAEIVVGAGARLEFVVVQELPARASSSSVTRIRLEQDAYARDLFAAFGAGTAKADLTIDAAGRGASADVLGVVFGGERQQFDHHTVLEHRAPDTSTSLDVRVALLGRAKSSTTGRLFIGGEAVRSQAYQENRNLLLSETASAISIPELEILTDEVQAKHGATVGPIDEDQLYYLRTRGLSADEATAMIVSGFFEALLSRIPEGSVRERVRTRVEARLSAPVPA